MDQELALSGNLEGLKDYFQANESLSMPEILDIIGQIPETIPPNRYKHLIPSHENESDSKLLRKFVIKRIFEIDETTSLVSHAFELATIAKNDWAIEGMEPYVACCDIACDLAYNVSKLGTTTVSGTTDTAEFVALATIYGKPPSEWLKLFFRGVSFSNIEIIQHHLLLHVIPALEKWWHAFVFAKGGAETGFSKFLGLELHSITASEKGPLTVETVGNLVLACATTARDLFQSSEDMAEVAITAVQVLERFQPLSQTNIKFLMQVTNLLKDTTDGIPTVLSEKMEQYQMWLSAALEALPQSALPLRNVGECIAIASDAFKQEQFVSKLVALAQEHALISSASISKQFEALLEALLTLYRSTPLLSRHGLQHILRPVLRAALILKLDSISQKCLGLIADLPDADIEYAKSLLFECALSFFKDPAHFNLAVVQNTLQLWQSFTTLKQQTLPFPPSFVELLLLSRAVDHLASKGLVFTPKSTSSRRLHTPMEVYLMEDRLELLAEYLERGCFASNNTKIKGPETFTILVVLAYQLEARQQPLATAVQALVIIISFFLQSAATISDFPLHVSVLDELTVWLAKLLSVCENDFGAKDEFWQRLLSVIILGEQQLHSVPEVLSWGLLHAPAWCLAKLLVRSSSSSHKPPTNLPSMPSIMPDWEWAHAPHFPSNAESPLPLPSSMTRKSFSSSVDNRRETELEKALAEVAFWMSQASSKEIADSQPEVLFQLLMRVDMGWALQMLVFRTLQPQWSSLLSLVDHLPSSQIYSQTVSESLFIIFFARMLQKAPLPCQLGSLYPMGPNALSQIWNQCRFSDSALFSNDPVLEKLADKISNLHAQVTNKQVSGLLGKMQDFLSVDPVLFEQSSEYKQSMLCRYACTASDVQFEQAVRLAVELKMPNDLQPELTVARLEFLFADYSHAVESSADTLRSFVAEIKVRDDGAFLKRSLKAVLQKVLQLHQRCNQYNYAILSEYYSFYGYLLGCLGTVKPQRLEQLDVRQQLLQLLIGESLANSQLTIPYMMHAVSNGREGILLLLIPRIKSMAHYDLAKTRLLPLMLQLSNCLSLPDETWFHLPHEALDLKHITSGLARYMISQVEPFLINQLLNQTGNDDPKAANLAAELSDNLNALGRDVLPSDDGVLPIIEDGNIENENFVDARDSEECIVM